MKCLVENLIVIDTPGPLDLFTAHVDMVRFYKVGPLVGPLGYFFLHWTWFFQARVVYVFCYINSHTCFSWLKRKNVTSPPSTPQHIKNLNNVHKRTPKPLYTFPIPLTHTFLTKQISTLFDNVLKPTKKPNPKWRQRQRQHQYHNRQHQRLPALLVLPMSQNR